MIKEDLEEIDCQLLNQAVDKDLITLQNEQNWFDISSYSNKLWKFYYVIDDWALFIKHKLTTNKVGGLREDQYYLDGPTHKTQTQNLKIHDSRTLSLDQEFGKKLLAPLDTHLMPDHI